MITRTDQAKTKRSDSGKGEKVDDIDVLYLAAMVIYIRIKTGTASTSALDVHLVSLFKDN